MITGEDMDRCIVEEFQADLAGLSVDEAKDELNQVQAVIDTETAWAEALAAYIRVEEAHGRSH